MPRLKYNDQYHSYWIDGTRATGVSTVAKGFQDSYNIDRKIKRDVAKGMARRPDLCTMVVALGDDDTWETKKKIDKIATDAIEASGAWAKANHGTAKHTILERVHKSLPLDDVFDDRLLAYAEAYRALIDQSGLAPVAHLTERFVVYPQEMIAGRMDCAYLMPPMDWLAEIAGPQILLGDFKSGTRAVQYPHSMVAQLGLYLNAPFLYNEETDEFDPAPLWGDTIVIAHVPDELDQFGLWTIDASLAKTVALAALERHRYIKAGADTLVKQWIVPAASPASFQVDARVGEPTAPPARTTQPADPFDDIATPIPERRRWIIGRLQRLKEAGAMGSVAARWPDGVPFLKNSDAHTNADYDKIVAILNQVEAEYTITFEEKDPTKEETTGRWTTSSTTPPDGAMSATNSSIGSNVPLEDGGHISTIPPTTMTHNQSPDEGPDADPDAVATLEQRYKDLPPEGRSWIAGIARDAQKAGRPITLLGAPTLRRFEIIRGLVALASAGYDEDEIVRGLIGALHPNVAHLFPSLATGEIVSGLDGVEARRFADLCAAYCAGTVTVTVDGDGRLVFS